MDFIYFLATGTDAWNDKYGFHTNYFIDGNGFLIGFGIAVAFGVIMSLAFYFGCCNNKSNALATIANWAIALVIAGAGAYFVGDLVVIGDANSGFEAANNAYCIDYCVNQAANNPQIQAEIQTELNQISDQLNKSEDIAFWFNLTNAIIAILVFYGMSLVVKNHTKHGSEIPHK